MRWGAKRKAGYVQSIPTLCVRAQPHVLRLATAAKKVLLGIEPRLVSSRVLGFRTDDPVTEAHIDAIGRAFLHGYDTALGCTRDAELIGGLQLVDPGLRGFAFEGAAMALTLLDEIGPGRDSRWADFLAGEGDAHCYMLHVGAGWAFARIPRGRSRLEAFLARCDPLLRWLVVDGYGFHHGFFRSVDALAGRPPKLSHPYAARAFDQGLGRSVWFLDGMDVARIAERISAFPRRRRDDPFSGLGYLCAEVERAANDASRLAPDRHDDLWSGVGLACAYAGGATPADLERLRLLAGAALPSLRQGVAFAATARVRAGNMVDHTREACRVLCETTPEELAHQTEVARRDLGPEPVPGDYETWRRQVALGSLAAAR